MIRVTNTEESLERSVEPTELARLLIALNCSANIRSISFSATSIIKNYIMSNADFHA